MSGIVAMEDTGNREQILLSYVPMCYAVALALTRNTRDAERLARDVVTDLWHSFARTAGQRSMKMTCLSALRAKFLAGYSSGAYPSLARRRSLAVVSVGRSGS